MNTRKWALAVSLLVLASMLLSACGASPTAGPAATSAPVVQTVVVTAPGGTPQVIEVTSTPAPVTPSPAEVPLLRINLGTYPDIIDPQKSSFANEIANLSLIYEGLTRLDENLETVPGAADEWEYNEDGTVLTFHIRDGLMYSDGTLLNAKRFEYALLRNINPDTAGEYAAITDDIAGAIEWRTADPAAEGYDPAALMAAVGVKALDDAGQPCQAAPEGYEQENCRTLQITTRAPAPYFHTVMSLWVTFPAKEENITTGGENWWNSSVYQIGNGPMVLQTLEPFVRARYGSNPNYWRGQTSYDLEFRFITDLAVSFEAYKADEFDIVPFQAEDLAQINADAELNAESLQYPGSCTFAVMFHQLKEPFTDQKVREAFAMALDREAYVRDVLAGLAAPTLTWIPPGYPGYQEGEARWGYDPEAAKQALTESSYGSAAALPEVKLTYGDTPRTRTRMEWLAAQWQTTLGVNVVLDPVEPTTYTNLTKDVATSPPVFLLGWCADYPDPQNWLSVYWKTGAFGERIGYSNPELDALLAQADAELDPDQRMELYQQAQDMLIAGAPVAFMYNNTNNYMVKPWVKGVIQTPQDAGWPGNVDPLSITIER